MEEKSGSDPQKKFQKVCFFQLLLGLNFLTKLIGDPLFEVFGYVITEYEMSSGDTVTDSSL